MQEPVSNDPSRGGTLPASNGDTTGRSAATATRKIWSVAAIVYGSLALLFVCMPDQVTSKLIDLSEWISLQEGPKRGKAGQPVENGTLISVARGLDGLVGSLRQGVGAVTAVSDHAGVEPFYQDLRSRFQAIVPQAAGT